MPVPLLNNTDVFFSFFTGNKNNDAQQSTFSHHSMVEEEEEEENNLLFVETKEHVNAFKHHLDKRGKNKDWSQITISSTIL